MRKRILWCALTMAAVAVVAVLELRNRLPWNSVVEIDIRGPIDAQEVQPSGGASSPAASKAGTTSTGGGGPTLREVTAAIDEARDDRRVGGIVVQMGDANWYPAVVEEIGAHIAAFRRSGKPSICFYDEEDDAVRPGNLASECDKKVGQGPWDVDEIEELFDARLGEDNWFPIEFREYLRKSRGGS